MDMNDTMMKMLSDDKFTDVTAISDFHGILPVIEPTELLLIAGDVIPFDIQRDLESSEYWFKTTFKEWVDNLQCNTVILIAGNHDFYLETLKTSEDRNEFSSIFDGKLIYLDNEEYTYKTNNGSAIRIFGTPYCSIFFKWAFMKDSLSLAGIFNKIPEGIDILLSHDPPMIGTVDMILKPNPYSLWPVDKGHVGNPELTQRLKDLKDIGQAPRMVISGHIHTGNHTIEPDPDYPDMTVVNVSMMDEVCYSLVQDPLRFYWHSRPNKTSLDPEIMSLEDIGYIQDQLIPKSEDGKSPSVFRASLL